LVQEIEFIWTLPKSGAASLLALATMLRSGSRVILYCETVFVIIEYPARQPIVKRPSGPRALFAGEADAGAYGL
jgi:hypothetical protein